MSLAKGSCKLRVDAGGEDHQAKALKEFIRNRFTKETTCLSFSMSH